MSRPVSIRVSYVNDLSFLTRLSQAIELDKNMTPHEKQRALRGCADVCAVLSEVSVRRMGGRAEAVTEETTEVED